MRGKKAEAEPKGGAVEGGSFEDLNGRLSEIVDALEAGELPLERSLQLFEEGMKISKALDAKLTHAERRVDELLGVDIDGRPVLKPLDRGEP